MEFIGGMNQGNTAGMLRELLDYDFDGGDGGSRRLSDWELRFIESLEMRLDHARGFLTPGQQDTLAEIWEAIFG